MIFDHFFTTHKIYKNEQTTAVKSTSTTYLYPGTTTTTTTTVSTTNTSNTTTTTTTTTNKKIQKTRSIQIRKSKSGSDLETLEISQETTAQERFSAQIQGIMKQYNSLYRDIERGTQRIHSIWENIVNEDLESCCDVGNWELQCEIAPRQQNQICSILSRIISLENSVLNRIDDLQNFIDSLCKVDKSCNLNSPCKLFKNDEDHLDHHQVTHLFKFDTKSQTFLSALELHEFLQVNEHIDRIMNAYDMITKVKAIVSHSCAKGDSEESAIELIHKKFLLLLQNFESTIVTLNKCLKLN